jgi:hypothetical protein
MPDQLVNVMKQRQQQFIHHLIDKTFDFSGLVKDIKYIQKDQIEAEGFKEDSMKPVLQQIVESLDAEQPTTEKFRNQLTNLLATGDHIKLLDRISKGSEYYKNILYLHLDKLLRHLEEMMQHKRVKTYVNQLTEIDLTLSKKLEEVDKASLLVSGILNGDDKFNFEPLNKLRVEERTKMLSIIRKETSSNVSSTKKGKSKKEKKPKTKDGLSTFETTLQMLNDGKGVEQIATERELTVGTIEGHLAKAVEAGSISIYKFMNDEVVTEIANAISQLPNEFSSKDLHSSLNGKFGYGQLRAVMAHVKQLKS